VATHHRAYHQTDERQPGQAVQPRDQRDGAAGADFRAIKAMLAKLDPSESWGGLSRTTPEGLTLYLCSHHAAKYR
jgi:hypothetical protein